MCPRAFCGHDDMLCLSRGGTIPAAVIWDLERLDRLPGVRKSQYKPVTVMGSFVPQRWSPRPGPRGWLMDMNHPAEGWPVRELFDMWRTGEALRSL